MFKIIAISCVLVGIVITLDKVKGSDNVVYNPEDIRLPQSVIIQEESVNNSPITSSDIEKLNHIRAIIETSITGYLNQFKNAKAACTIVYNDGLAVINQTVSILNSCLTTTKETIIINSKIQRLIDSANSVKKAMAENMQATITECSQRPFNITSCLGTINRNLAEINLKNLADIAMANILQKFPLFSFFPSITKCYKDFRQYLTSNYFKRVSNDTKICFEDIEKIFRS